MTKLEDKAIRALELVAKGVPSAAICERLGITRNRLYQIRHYAGKPRPPATATALQLNGEHLET